MKITSFNPSIVTKDAEAIVSVFEALGFEKKHNPTGTAGENQFVSYRMSDSNGFHVDVTSSTAPRAQDLTCIRMNVDDFDEAYAFLTARGFKNMQNGTVTDTGSAKACMLYSPSGFGINLIQHIRKHD